MQEHPQMKSLLLSGIQHIYSSQTQSLNDNSAEYTVQVIKHFFDKFIIVQYVITNTLEDHILTKV